MSIESVIKQKKFPSEYIKSEINILYTANWIENISNKFFKPYNISMQQYNVLRILRGQNGAPIMLSGISDRMIDKNSNATRLVEKLRQKDLVSRSLNPDNRRQVDILITAKGLELLSDIDMNFSQMEVKFKNITLDEAVELNRILDKMRGSDDELIEEFDEESQEN